MKDIIDMNKFRLIFLGKIALFKYCVNFALNNNVETLKFIIYLKVFKNNILLNNIFK